MKKTITMLLCIGMLLSICAPAALAESAVSEQTVQQTICALGIMSGDTAGNMKLSNDVTRAEFCKMMVAASGYKDTAGGASASSVFRDVKNTHWAAGYIETAVNAGWMVGYIDGTFRPDSRITLEQAAACVLRLLGYTSANFFGAYPKAHLTKFAALSLNSGISAKQGESLTRRDCMYIFFNLMNAKTENGKVYATVLGYTVNAAGKLDYSALVSSGTEGPFVIADDRWAERLPFTPAASSVYKNGNPSNIVTASKYDVYYYNSNIRTVWIYSNRISGLYTAASPDTSAPTSVTVAGNSYKIGSSDAAYALSNMGAFSTGESVVLLLGKGDEVAGVLPIDKASGVKYGMVLSLEVNTYKDSAGKSAAMNTVTVICTDGVLYKYDAGSTNFNAGSIVSVTTANGSVSVKVLNTKSLKGSVNAAGTKLGDYKFAKNAEILDTDKNGEYAVVYPSRLSGYTVQSGSVRYYALDDNGDIACVILDDATGDIHKYAAITNAKEHPEGMSAYAAYGYILNGTAGTYNPDKVFGVSEGGAVFLYKGAAVERIENLSKVVLSEVNTNYAMSKDKKYSMSDAVQVYLKDTNGYHATSLSAVSDTSKYSLVGFYDSYSLGGRIRIVKAEALPH